jgi:outer membrane protein OmpA-like peptidoglycan-associated protein
MKKSLVLFSALFVLLSINALGQSSKYGWLHKESWAFGFGLSYPRYISTSSIAGDYGNIGGFISIQKNYTEHLGLRFEANYDHMTVKNPGDPNKESNEIISGNFDLLYYLVPCEPVSPYMGIGFGGEAFNPKSLPKIQDQHSWGFAYQFNLRFGSEWKVGENWRLKTELSYSTSASKFLDASYGTGAPGNLIGGAMGSQGDSYLLFDVGLVYYFHFGDKSNICEIYEGLNKVDYDKIEDIIKKYQTQPTEVDYTRIEDIVKKYQNTSSGSGMNALQENWVLIGINFDFNKATIRPESIPILYNAAEILLKNPDVKVEIQGHTDNIGSDNYNQKLSLRRAESVRNFLVAKGIASNRLTTVGMGETKPIMDNKTEQGRGLNRRIEFKIVK